MKFDYSTLDNHIKLRGGLPPKISQILLPEQREDWLEHGNYEGKAKFFMNIHDQLATGTGQLIEELDFLLEQPNDIAEFGFKQKKLLSKGNHIISFAHGHHNIEDHHYFPAFERLYPQFGNAMKLLDGDHRVLEEALIKTEKAFKQVQQKGVSKARLNTINKASKTLKRILNRHFVDEEDIIIPILLKHG